MLQIARDQVDFGAHALDVSVAVTERSDEAEMMHRLDETPDPRSAGAAGDRYD